MSLRNIVVVGAAGKLGAPLVRSLIQSTNPKYNVTALIRPSSTYSPPADLELLELKVVKANLDDHTELVEKLKGQDALILTMPANQDLAPTSIKLINAAVEAGIQLVIPSEFGSDESTAMQPLYQSKKAVNQYLEKAASEDKISYTLIRNGPWFDVAFEAVIGMNLEAKKATLYDNGDRKAHTTTIDSVCLAINSILSNPALHTNQIVHIHDFFLTQQEILVALEAVTGQSFEVEKVDVNELGRVSKEKLMRGDFSVENVLGVVNQSVWGEEDASRWNEKDDSVSLGLGHKDLKEEIRKIAAKAT